MARQAEAAVKEGGNAAVAHQAALRGNQVETGLNIDK
jgi:hypothetical protein